MGSWGKNVFSFCLIAVIAYGFLAVFLLHLPSAKASSSAVINEIHPNPGSGETEWLEIYNSAGFAIDISNYSLKKSSSETSKNLSVINCSTSDDIYYTCDLGSSWLVNTGATITLIQDSLAIDEVTYESFDNLKGKSFARIPNGFDSDDSQADFHVLAPSKGLENVLPKYVDTIFINEIVPQPATGSADEFVELFNSSVSEIDLSDWLIDDIKGGGSSPYLIPSGTVILAGEYLTFYNSTTKIAFNDSGDSVRLIDPNGDEKSSTNYLLSKRGQSYSKFADGWQWTTLLTPKSLNILAIEFLEPDQDKQVIQTDIIGAKNQSDGVIVEVVGVVSVAPGKLSTQYFYIQDGKSGIQIYCYGKLFPELKVGDQVKIVGELATISGERRIKTLQISDIQILSTHPPPEPIMTTIDNLNNDIVGQYITVFGIVTKTSGNTFYIHGSGEVQIIVRTGTGIKKPRMSVGDTVQISGILSNSNDMFRILPTRQDDVKIVKSSNLPDTGQSLWFVLTTSFIFSIFIWNILQKVQKKRRNWLKSS